MRKTRNLDLMEQVLPRPRVFNSSRWISASLWASLVVVAAVWGAMLQDLDPRMSLGAAPLFGRIEPMFSADLLAVAIVGILLILSAERILMSCSWRALVIASVAACFTWVIALALVSDAGLMGGITSRHEPFVLVDASFAPGVFLETFTERIASYPIHVQGHPPGAVLIAWLLTLGPAGPLFASLAIIGMGASAVAAALLTVALVWDEDAARRAAPFIVAAPAAVWLGTSLDAAICAVSAWAVAFTIRAMHLTGAWRLPAAVIGGLLFGVAAMLSYGTVVLWLVPAWFVWRHGDWDVAGAAAVAGIAFVGSFGFAGFWWHEGLWATRERYLAGVSQHRPYQYFLLGNLAALGIAAGPVVVEGLRVVSRSAGRLLLLPVIMGVSLANLSGMSKGEVERIWLLFVPWLLASSGAIVARRRAWLVAQISVAVGVQAVVVTPW